MLLNLRVPLLRRLATALLGHYEIFLILYINCDTAQELAFGDEFSVSSSTPSQRDDGKHESWRFEYSRGGQVLCRCAVWTGAYYRKVRDFIPLTPGEAELVLLETAPEARGQGLAPRLLQYAVHQCKQLGLHRLYCRIWHSNTPSIRAFTKAGWHRHQLALSAQPILIGRRINWRLRLRR